MVAGLDLAAAGFKALDPDAQFVPTSQDGGKVAAGTRIARVQARRARC